METVIIIAIILVILGIIGSILPAIPGPLFGYAGLLIIFFAKGVGLVPTSALVTFGIAFIVLTVIDYIAPILGAKFAGSSKKGVWGSIIGAFIGIVFLPPLGIFLGALVGAVIGELIAGKEFAVATKAAVGVVLGSLTVIILQTIYSIILAIYFFTKIF